MKKKRPMAKKRWAPGKPLPKFATATEEERFWLSHDFDDAMDAGGEEVVYAADIRSGRQGRGPRFNRCPRRP